MTLDYNEMRKEYLLKLKYQKVKPNCHDAYLSMKECNFIYDAYLYYRSYIGSNLLFNNHHKYNNDYLLDLCDRLLELSTLMADKLIDGFFNYEYSDEKSYTFTDQEIKMYLLKEHFHKNSKEGLSYKISLINRAIIDNIKRIYSQNLETEDVVKEQIALFSTNIKSLFMELDGFN